MQSITKEISRIGIVPVIKIKDIAKAVPLAKALCEGGIPCAEVTFRAAGAEQAIAAIVKEVPDMLVGAGTVLTCEQVDRAAAAGAKFIVSPGLNPDVVSYCQSKNLPVFPGCSTASDIERAIGLGLETVKFFPAEAMGGLKTIKALAGPYGDMTFMPTGGINENNLNDYLAYSKVVACGGSWMVSETLIDAGDFAQITLLARKAVQKMLGIELAHIGINSANADEALKTANLLASIFGAANDIRTGSIFVGTEVEVLKQPGRGTNGHIALAVNHLERAAAYFTRRGYELDELVPGSKAVYFKNEIAGFALHLLQK